MEESGEKKGTAKKKHLDNNLSGVDKAVGILGYKNSITNLLIFFLCCFKVKCIFIITKEVEQKKKLVSKIAWLA